MTQDPVLCCWTVTAGFRPQERADRFTRTMVVTYDDWGCGDVPGQRLRAARGREAFGYASKLMSDESFAWVNVEYRSNDSPWTESAGPRMTRDGEPSVSVGTC